jgi:hypothetical protein
VPQPPANSDSEETIVRKSTIVAPTTGVVALVILLGSLSGGVVGGLALWLFLAYEFATAAPRAGGDPASQTTSRPGLLTWCRRPLQKLLRSHGPSAPARKASGA